MKLRGVAKLGLRRYLGVVEIAGSNPVAPTKSDAGVARRRFAASLAASQPEAWSKAAATKTSAAVRRYFCGGRYLGVVEIAGSNPVAPIIF